MDLQAFVNQWSGQLSCDGGLCECVALVNQWADANGWPKPQGVTAATLSFPAGWESHPATEAQPGDVVIWDAALPGSNGSGHTAIYLGPGPLPGASFNSFDQNWGGSHAHVEGHDFFHVREVWRYSAMLSQEEHDALLAILDTVKGVPERRTGANGGDLLANLYLGVLGTGAPLTPTLAQRLVHLESLAGVQPGGAGASELAQALRAAAHALDGG